ncbi:MAG TPA: helix-turn-helix domain-containing protein [Myxococcaceae bacterium]|jgi:transcriptional regulator with XRE-family HTH domain
MDKERLKTIKEKLGVNIRNARLRRGLTQEQAAEQIGISPEVYGRLERGGIFPRVSRLLTICEKLGVSADQLLELSPVEGPLPTVSIPRWQDDWFLLTHRIVALIPKLSHHQRLAARRQLAELYRMLLSIVNPNADPSERLVKRKRPRAVLPEPQASEEVGDAEEEDEEEFTS